MTHKTTLKKKPLSQWVWASLTAVGISGVALAAPLAGTVIKNLATVTYEDSLGNKYSAQSNEAVITVAPVYFGYLEGGSNKAGAPGQTVYVPYIYTNTGNVNDTIAITAVDADSNSLSVYNDINSNGQPDAGEDVVTSVSLDAGQSANLVVAYDIPTTSVSEDAKELTITTTAGNTGSQVTDSDSGDADGDNASIDNAVSLKHTVTTSDSAVTVSNKSQSIDRDSNADYNLITYTLTGKNTGLTGGTNITMIDVLPGVDLNQDGEITSDEQLTVQSGSVSSSGLLTANGDTLAAVVANYDEATVGWDVNNDGDMTDSLNVLKAVDADMPSGTTVTVQFTLMVPKNNADWPAGTQIQNTFSLFEDSDGNGKPDPGTGITEPSGPSNKLTYENDAAYSVAVSDTGIGAADADNDGGDDDSTVNDAQHVAAVGEGETVIYKVDVENTGNSEDRYNLTMDAGTFPPGTVFSYWNADGSVQLLDSNTDGKMDTGAVEVEEIMTITIKAKLPSGVTGTPATPHTATLTTTSVNDTDKTDTVALTLAEITAPAVDLATTDTADAANAVDLGFNDSNATNADTDQYELAVNDVVLGGKANFALSIANESSSAQAFMLEMIDLPAGWAAAFQDASGNTITSTPLMPANGRFDFKAVVTVSDDLMKALGDNPSGVDATGDADKDYIMKVKVSAATVATNFDEVGIAVDVKPSRDVVLSPAGINQVSLGGTAIYNHKLENKGNATESFELAAADSNSTGWKSNLRLDTDGAGAYVNIGNLAANDVVKVTNADGSLVDMTLTDTDSDNIPEVTLGPGQSLDLQNVVLAPSSAPEGQVNMTSITATNMTGGPDASVQDSTTISSQQVRLYKQVAADANCDNTADGAFMAVQSTQVAPGECMVWKLEAVNESSESVLNVVVGDSIPEYTTYLAGSLTYCLGQACTLAALTDDDDADAGKYNSVADEIQFLVGDRSANVAGQIGGKLVPGERAYMTFTTKVDD